MQSVLRKRTLASSLTTGSSTVLEEFLADWQKRRKEQQRAGDCDADVFGT
ncbi:MAG TPA: hypothetical protein O0X50_03000 [Methanocorpusculum sp.]|nr:hypothetical protein [Methanocorpusculum sp.]